jgi:ADP-heptose:LPS heptosyltransferase
LSLVKARYKAGYESLVAPADMALTLPLPASGVCDRAGGDKPEKDHHMTRLLTMLASGVVADFSSTAPVREALAASADTPDDAVFPRGLQAPVIGINTGSGTETKKWPLERFAELADRLIRTAGATVILFGAQAEKKDAARLAAGIPPERFIDCTGRLTLPQFIGALGRLDLYIGNDTGTTHIAAALDVPTLCLFSGAARLALFHPAGRNISILYHGAPCAPCGVRKIEDCPADHLCMHALTTDRVTEEALKMLDAVETGKSRNEARPARAPESDSHGLSQEVA